MATRASYGLVKTTNVNLIRPPVGYYDDTGTWVEDKPTVSVAKMNIQPIQGHRLVTLPDAFRSKDSILIFTNYPLRGLEGGSEGYKGDIISYGDHTYRVHITQPYRMGVRDHVEAYAIREDLLTKSAEKIALDALMDAVNFRISADDLYHVANVEFPERLGL